MGKSTKVILLSIAITAMVATGVWFYMGAQDQDAGTSISAPSADTGISLFKEKKYEEALEVFESIPPGGEREWYTRYYQGSTHIMLKDYQAAADTLEQALALNNSETRIMHALGVAYFKLGNLKMSKAYFAAVLEIEPDNAEARGLMDIMARLEKTQELEATQDPEGTLESGG